MDYDTCRFCGTSNSIESGRSKKEKDTQRPIYTTKIDLASTTMGNRILRPVVNNPTAEDLRGKERKKKQEPRPEKAER